MNDKFDQQTNEFEIPQGCKIADSMSFKKDGKFAVFGNVFVAVMFVVGLVSMYFLFDYNFSTEGLTIFALSLFISFLIIAVFLILNPLIQAIFYKLCGGGKLKLHFGLLIEIYCEKPISKNDFIFAQLASNIIPIAALSIAALFFWKDFVFISLVICASNLLAYIPVYHFLSKYNKTASVKFFDGNLYVLTTVED